MAKAPYIEVGRLRHLFKVNAISGGSPIGNFALLTTVYGTGMTLTEIARIAVRAYLYGDDSVRVKSCVAAAIAYNGKERPIYWSNTKVVKAINVYLTDRIARRHQLTPIATEYRDLGPYGPIFLTGDGEPYKLIERRTSCGGASYSCDSLSQLFLKLDLQAGIEGANAMSSRRTFAVRLANKDFVLRHINELLGHETLTATKRLIDADPVCLSAIVAG